MYEIGDLVVNGGSIYRVTDVDRLRFKVRITRVKSGGDYGYHSMKHFDKYLKPTASKYVVEEVKLNTEYYSYDSEEEAVSYMKESVHTCRLFVPKLHMEKKEL